MSNLSNSTQNRLLKVPAEYRKYFYGTSAVLVLGFFIFLASLANDIWQHASSPQQNVAAAIAHAAKCENNADVTIGFGGLGTGLIPQLSNGVYNTTKATPGGKYYGCMIVACRDTVGRAFKYVQQQAQAAGGRRITVDIMGHSAGADGSVHLARRLASLPNVYVRRIIAADATAFAGAVPSGVGHVVNLNSSWASKTPLSGQSPIQYVNRGDRNHMTIDDLIPENFPCLAGEGPCKTGEEAACKNRCSTTYTEVDGGQPKVTDCYGKGEDKAKKAVEALVRCVANNSEGVSGPDEIQKKYELLLPDFEKGMCTAQWGEGAEKGKPDNNSSKEALTKKGEHFAIISALPLIVYPIKTPPVPEACMNEYTTILGIMGAHNGDQSAAQFATSATKEDAAKCAWKGAVVCYPNTQKPGKLVCKKKIEAHQQKPPGPGNNTTQCVLNNRNNPSAITECLNMNPSGPVPPGTTGLTGSPFGSSKNTQQAFQGQPQTQNCPVGHKKSESNGKVVCLQDDTTASSTASSLKPECLMVANKEKVAAGEPVVLQWRTANAEKVSLAPVKESVEKTGKVTHNPKETTTYKLTATNKGGVKKTCEAEVKVEGTAGDTEKENKPLLGCHPGLIKKGQSAKILWSCADGANSIETSGFLANKQLKGEVVVRPLGNTQYEIMCSRGSSLVGKNMCSVRVGVPEFDIVVDPKRAEVGERVRVSWASLFMKKCAVTGPRGFSYSRLQGIVLTEPFASVHAQKGVNSTTYRIVCESEFGDTISGKATVHLSK